MKLSHLFKRKVKEELVKGFDIYGEKGTDLPRLIYRRLLVKLTTGHDRLKAIGEFIAEVETAGGKGDFLKMKWTLPDYLKQELSTTELQKLESFLSDRRAKRNKKFIEVYPHSVDEFSLSDEFIEAAFSHKAVELLGTDTKIFTIGSCFARNIARFLVSEGYRNVMPFTQAEDLNSPLSNAKMLQVAIADEEQKLAYLDNWTRRFNPELSDKDVKKIVTAESGRLENLVSSLRKSEILVITIGNTLDFFIPDRDDIAPDIPVAPKFLAVMNNENVEFRSSVSSQLKKAGATFRLASYAEAKASIATLYQAVRKINPTAPCIITLSPVPMDSAIGIKAELPYGAIELDAISKSTLRTALFELFDTWSAENSNVIYFPSFEIVRWIGGNLRDMPMFGNEDAASRHVSEDILKAVYRFFLRNFAMRPSTRNP